MNTVGLTIPVPLFMKACAAMHCGLALTVDPQLRGWGRDSYAVHRAGSEGEEAEHWSQEFILLFTYAIVVFIPRWHPRKCEPIVARLVITESERSHRILAWKLD